jgi:hypothetical protein
MVSCPCASPPLTPARLETNRRNAKKSIGPHLERGKHVARTCSSEPALNEVKRPMLFLVARTCSLGPRLFRAGAEEPQTLKNRCALRVFLRTKPLNI